MRLNFNRKLVGKKSRNSKTKRHHEYSCIYQKSIEWVYAHKTNSHCQFKYTLAKEMQLNTDRERKKQKRNTEN